MWIESSKKHLREKKIKSHHNYIIYSLRFSLDAKILDMPLGSSLSIDEPLKWPITQESMLQ